MSIFSLFQQHLSQTTVTRFLIGFSGGLDSTALLALFAKLRKNQPHFELRAIHIHHGLSKNADYWAEHCQQICLELDIPLIVERVQVKGNEGVESNARKARYQAVKNHIKQGEVFVTAHHQQDQTETFFLALKRGSGVQGLSAMQNQSNLFGIPIVRPLLNISRQQLEHYANIEGLTWIEDESNQDNRYERNFLRNQVLPLLRERWNYFDQAVQRSTMHCFEQQQLLHELLAPDFERHFDPQHHTFSLEQFDLYSVPKQTALLRLWLSELHQMMPSSEQLKEIVQTIVLARKDANPRLKLNDCYIRRYQDKLYLTPSFIDLRSFKLDIRPDQQIELPDSLGIIITQQRQEGIFFSWQQYQVILKNTNLPIQIRFHYSGSVRLHKNRPSQDIKKIWQSLQIPPWQRSRIPLIFYGEKFQCAIGFIQSIE
ncbi:tRNA lysidine(34) synthetase TilS [Rodentibacter caecimuris]|uniref:tRNA(Ile)-lysidine synthase n=1 Tax=Rodentibacter caecimuris TaxID=1796644 RepID=A0ABX3KW86_9PAST|nr:tRNA lysidine(34) synthetase TilS [Rodentibacter heylii]